MFIYKYIFVNKQDSPGGSESEEDGTWVFSGWYEHKNVDNSYNFQVVQSKESRVSIY